MTWTHDQLRDYELRRGRKPAQPDAETTIPKSQEPALISLADARFLPSPSTDEAGLNKTEGAYLSILRGQSPRWLGIQCITLKLAHDTRYTPDFWTLGVCGQLVAHEVKGGFMREDGWIKVKLAARLYPMFVFRLARKTKAGWKMMDVKP